MTKSGTKSESNWNDLAEALKSVAHPERIAILHLMCNCGCDQIMVKSIYEKLHLEQSITSRHLGIMKKSGLLKREIKQGKIFYRLNNDSLAARCIQNILKTKA
ncbi:MAG: winged helix-turn-helix transcriptional regulator [Bacteroidetes bacterium]|nr:winged helix-turn-helix transcriptional regulator [Bacteroidota bacterium]